MIIIDLVLGLEGLILVLVLGCLVLVLVGLILVLVLGLECLVLVLVLEGQILVNITGQQQCFHKAYNSAHGDVKTLEWQKLAETCFCQTSLNWFKPMMAETCQPWSTSLHLHSLL